MLVMVKKIKTASVMVVCGYFVVWSETVIETRSGEGKVGRRDGNASLGKVFLE